MLSLGQAARLTGVDKTTITRAIKAGRLSAARRDNGSYAIDPAELSRVYDVHVATPATVAPEGGERRDATPVERPRDPESDPLAAALMAAKDAELRALRELLEAERRRGDELRQERDRWQEQAARLALPAPVVTASPGRAWWWWRRAG